MADLSNLSIIFRINKLELHSLGYYIVKIVGRKSSRALNFQNVANQALMGFLVY
jgi:hypothetical protein